MFAPHCPPDPAKIRDSSNHRGFTTTLSSEHAHHLGGGLRDDGVAAGADVGHVGLDRHHAAGRSSRTRAPDLVSMVVAKAPRPRPCRPASCPSRTCAGFGCALATSRSDRRRCFRHCDQLSLRERPRRLSRGRPGCRSCTRNSIGSMPRLLGHLVHRDLQRHQPRRLARRAHGVALGQVERRRASCTVMRFGAGIEQARLADRRLGPAARQVARPGSHGAMAVMLAVRRSRRCGCAGWSPAGGSCCWG